MPPTGGVDSREEDPQRENHATERGTQGKAGLPQKERGLLAIWQRMKGHLKEITESLDEAEEEGVKEGIRGKLKLVEGDIDALYGQAASQEQSKIAKTIKEIDKKMDALINKTGTQKASTWAEIAAGNPPGALPQLNAQPSVFTSQRPRERRLRSCYKQYDQ